MKGKKFFLVMLFSMIMVFSSAITCFASETEVEPIEDGMAYAPVVNPTFTAPNLDSTQYDSYIVVRTPSQYRCIVYMSSDWRPYIDGNYLMWEKLDELAYVRYSSVVEYNSYDSSLPNNGWGTMSQFDSLKGGCFEVLLANNDIYDSESNLVFQVTPPLKVATEVALTELQTGVGGAMMILVACGVGLIASLVGLRLFGKVLPIFRA